MKNMNRRGRFTFLLAIVMGLAALAAAACADATPTATTSSQSPTATSTVGPQPTTTGPLGEGQRLITVLRHASLGDILVDHAGFTLYIFTQDSPGVSACTSTGCVATWPPVTTAGQPMFEITSAQLGTITRGDGLTQVTVNGLPVYYYTGDNARGDANGQGLGDQWYVLNAAGSAVTAEPSASNGAGGGGTAAIIDNFSLPNLQVSLGTTVTWTNQESLPHTATHSNGSAFDSGTLNQGDSYSFTFDEAGRYEYICTIHPTMTGVVVVSAGAEPTATQVPATATTPAATSTPTVSASTPIPLPTQDPLGEQYSAEIQSFTHVFFTIPAGTTVTWTNRDSIPHTVSSGTPEDPTSVFNSPMLAQNQTYTFTFDVPGEYPYFCSPHPDMRGSVTVE